MQNAVDAIMTNKTHTCDCYDNSRFDASGRLVLLYTCHACLEEAYKKIRESVCNSLDGVVQLELIESNGAEGSSFRFGYRPSVAEGGRSE